MSKQLILGTAGHIDHGKTSMIRTLTGIDTDRLKEEKARGITIELGFAYLPLPDGGNIGIVDVPGHEKFVKHMVAGASGIDLVALVVAADEGIMPQTREHVEICELLGVKHGLIVLTKVDMVDEEWLELVEEDVRDYVADTFLADAPMIHFSAETGQGREELIQVIGRVAGDVTARQAGSLFRLPLDRVFTMKGFGTVITGTSLSGSVSVGDPIMVYPSGSTSKVRGLQVHGHGVERAEAGSRTAVNLQGLEKAAIERGMVLAPPDTLHPSRRMDLKVQYLSGNEKPLKNRTQVRFHTGSSETLGRLLLLDAEELAPGQSGMAQVLLESDAVALGGDRFVLRSYSPVRTIGGGEILNPAAPRHKRFNPNTLAELEALAAKDPVESIRILIQSAGASGVSATQLAGLIDLPAGKIKSALEQLLSRQEAVTFDKERGRVLSRTTVDQLSEAVLGILADFHQRYPLRPGLVKEELKTRVPGLAESRVLAFILDRLAKSGRAVIERDVVRLAEHQVSLAGDFEAIENKLTEVIAAAGAMPPYFKDVSAQLPGGPQQHKEVLDHLVKKGRLVKVKTDLYYDRAVLDELWSKARDILKTQGELTTPGFKDAVGLSRKYLIPILEHFDARGLTMRIGDKRVLRSEG